MCSAVDPQACPCAGFPIRISPALAVAHTSLELVAVYRVLHRRLTPQAFTVRPCSFSTCVTEKSIFLAFHSSSSYALGKEPVSFGTHCSHEHRFLWPLQGYPLLRSGKLGFLPRLASLSTGQRLVLCFKEPFLGLALRNLFA
jgi:hypothetical protein